MCIEVVRVACADEVCCGETTSAESAYSGEPAKRCHCADVGSLCEDLVNALRRPLMTFVVYVDEADGVR